MDFNESAEDYNNQEWFQISFSFDGEGDPQIDAMGTMYPENYEAFRKELLVLLVPTVKEQKEKMP